MRISTFLPLLASGLAYAASWGFDDASLSILDSKISSEPTVSKYVLDQQDKEAMKSSVLIDLDIDLQHRNLLVILRCNPPDLSSLL